MKGRLIIIESGSDASGKATQSERLYQRLLSEGYPVRKVEYPNYRSPSSALVKMYLNGDFGKNPQDVSPYVASTFYAVDRFASYKTEWEEFYRAGGMIVADRYTTSNMVHQAAKIAGPEKEKFLDWLWDLEFNLYRLPVPDEVIFLDMPVEFSTTLMTGRANKFTEAIRKDIHEDNKDYQTDSYRNGLQIARKYGWKIICCVEGERLKTVEEIHQEIYQYLKGLF